MHTKYKWPPYATERKSPHGNFLRTPLATPKGQQPRGRPSTRWSDYIFDRTWFRLGVESAELSEITEKPEVYFKSS